MLLYNTIHDVIKCASSFGNIPDTIVEPFIFSDHSENILTEYITYELKNSGFCFISMGYDTSQFMAVLHKILGDPQVQNQKQMTEVMVRPIDGATRYINTNAAQPLHTDNGYSMNYPSIIALRCLKMASQGGETLVVNIGLLLDYLRSNFSEDIDSLYEPQAITYIFGSLSVTKSILYKDRAGRTKITFSIFADAIVCQTEDIEKLFLAIVAFIHRPSNQKQFLLKDQDIVIVDNQRALHGRKAFIGERQLVRTWYNFELPID